MADVRWVPILFWTFLILTFVLLSAVGERTSQKIYDNLQGDTPCFRRLNATHQIGCTSERSGNVGVVHYITNATDFEWLINHGPYEPYIVIIEPSFFNRKNLTEMQNSKKINGILVISPVNSSVPDGGFSPDYSCPNQKYGLYDQCSVNWNPHGDGMFFEDWKFPIFLVQNQTDINNLIENCYRKFNEPKDGKPRSWPLCAAELSSNMFAAKDSPTCMRRSDMVINLNPARVCDPLGDLNVWASLKPMNKSSPPLNRSLIVVAARMDTFSMFEGVGPGADSAVSGLVALLATAQALKNATDGLNLKNVSGNVLFVMFNGEAFDYIGSSRMVYDMMQKSFPNPLDDSIPEQPPLITLDQISYFIEFNQVGLLNSSDPVVWAHSDPLSTSSPEVNNTVFDLFHLLHNKSMKDMRIEIAPYSNPLPSASFQRFLKEDLMIPGLVLSDHEKVYSNKYYNSMFDGPSIVQHDIARSNMANYIENLSTIVARSIYKLLTDEDSEIIADGGLVEEMLDCYLNTGNCSLFNKVSPENTQSLLKSRTDLYVGVNKQSKMRDLTSRLLMYLLGSPANLTEATCSRPSNNTVLNYIWFPTLETNQTSGKGACYRSTVYTSPALSPAFVINDYTSGNYSTWTESVWSSFTLRIFLKPSFQQEVVTLCIGIVILLSSFSFVYLLNDSSDILFTNSRLISGSC